MRQLMEGDIEAAQQTEFEQMQILQDAGEIMHELEEQENAIIRFRLGQSKTIKCKYCDHKGQSTVEESTSIITFMLFTMIILATRDYLFSFTWMYVSFQLLFVLPFLAGILRIQTHCCPECLNEVK